MIDPTYITLMINFKLPGLDRSIDPSIDLSDFDEQKEAAGVIPHTLVPVKVAKLSRANLGAVVAADRRGPRGRLGRVARCAGGAAGLLGVARIGARAGRAGGGGQFPLEGRPARKGRLLRPEC